MDDQDVCFATIQYEQTVRREYEPSTGVAKRKRALREQQQTLRKPKSPKQDHPIDSPDSPETSPLALPVPPLLEGLPPPDLPPARPVSAQPVYDEQHHEHHDYHPFDLPPLWDLPHSDHHTIDHSSFPNANMGLLSAFSAFEGVIGEKEVGASTSSDLPYMSIFGPPPPGLFPSGDLSTSPIPFFDFVMGQPMDVMDTEFTAVYDTECTAVCDADNGNPADATSSSILLLPHDFPSNANPGIETVSPKTPQEEPQKEQKIVAATTVQDVTRGVETLDISENTLELWKSLEKLLTRVPIVGRPPPDTKTWSDHFRDIVLVQEPDDQTLERWSSGDFCKFVVARPLSDKQLSAAELALHNPINDPLTKNKFCEFESDEIPEDFYLTWRDMSALQRFYVVFCIEQDVQRELKEIAHSNSNDPYMRPWSFQFLMICLLRGSDFLKSRVRAILASMGDLARWHDRYLFAGGFLRRELVEWPAEQFPAEVVDILIHLLNAKSDWVAFFEQVENFNMEFAAIRSKIPASVPIHLTHDMFSRPELKVKSGIFERVESVGPTDAWIKYYGCPRPIQLQIAKITSPKLLGAIKSQTA